MGTHERHWMHRSVIASPRIEGSLISRFHRSFARSRVCLLVYTRTIVPKFASPVVEIKITSQQQRPALRQGISSMLANVKQRLSAGVCVGAFRKQIQSLAGASYSVILVGHNKCGTAVGPYQGTIIACEFSRRGCGGRIRNATSIINVSS
jgi:hypothetical protein